MMDLAGRDIRQMEIAGFRVGLDVALGHLWVEHDGTITWDELQDIKNAVWGKHARAIEVYPAQAGVVNNAPLRHLWRLGRADFAPDLLGHFKPDRSEGLNAALDLLELRSSQAWGRA